MRIVIFLTSFLPEWVGGTEIATHNIAKILARFGHDVHVVAARDGGLAEYSLVDGYHIHRLPEPKIRIVGVLFFWLRTIALLRKIEPTIVHVQDLGNGLLGLLSKITIRVPYVVWAQGSDVYSPRTLEKISSKLVLAYADAVLALTHDMKLALTRWYQRSISVLPNGVNLSEFVQSSHDETTESVAKRIVFVGSLRPVKGLRFLIEAMKLVIERVPTAQLVLVGEGECRARLELLAKNLKVDEFVNFVGRVPHNSVAKYLASSQVFALPSLSEGLPLVVLESLASGLPVVATKIRGMSEFIVDNENGFLVEPMNSRELAEKILLVLGNDELRRRMSDNCLMRAKQYDWQEIVTRLESIYFDCIND